MNTVGKLGMPRVIRQMPDNITYDQIVDFLNEVQRSPGVWQERKLARRLMEARLWNNRYITKVIGTQDWGNRFDELGDALIGGHVAQVYKVTDKLLYDINVVRDWLATYEQLIKLNLGSYRLEQITLLGQAILGRAVELCPIETGALRASGRLVVIPSANTVMITFDCPYASYVHEDTNKRHSAGQSKFLEQAAQEIIPYQSTWIQMHEDGGVWIAIELDYTVRYGHYNA